MIRSSRPKVMVHYFPLSRLKKLHLEGTQPHWRYCHDEATPMSREERSIEFEYPDGTGDLGGIIIADIGGGRASKDFPLLAASRNALPHLIAVVEAALALEAEAPGDPRLAGLSRALDVFRERKRS